MIHAIVLVRAERGCLTTLGSALADVDGVSEAYSVTGHWDFVAIIRVLEADQLAEVVASKLAQLSGIAETYTMVAFRAFSRHDLEAVFTAGA